MLMKRFDILPHTADFKIRVYGKTLQKLFANACIGMFTSAGPQSEFCKQKNTELECVTLPQKHDIKVLSIDKEMLLVDFLSEALYLSDVHNEAYLAVDMHMWSETSLHATVRGVKVTRFDIEIKAVTYHDLTIQKTLDGWSVDIVFDI